MVTYNSAEAFQAKMAAKLAALAAPPAKPEPEPEPDPVQMIFSQTPITVTSKPFPNLHQWVGGHETSWNGGWINAGTMLDGQVKLSALHTNMLEQAIPAAVAKPKPSVDTDVSTWTPEEKAEAQKFWDTWNVGGTIDCDCSERLCVRARALWEFEYEVPF